MRPRSLVRSIDPQHPDDSPEILSYFAMRRVAGWIGIALPVIVVIFDQWISKYHCIPASISASYYTGARNVFIGSLSAVGVFLICSIGYKPDRFWSLFAGAMAFLVAFCPTKPDTGCQVPNPGPPFTYSHYIHMFAATALFITFAIFCLFLFTRSADTPNKFGPHVSGLPRQKKKRNALFIFCGCVMGVAMLFYAFASHLLPNPPHRLLLVIEWICLWAFGCAWLVKGQLIFADSDPPGPQR